MAKDKKQQNKKFPGIPSNWGSSFWKCPRIMDEYWWSLNGRQRVVLLFILRQTLGFNKMSDKLMITQFTKGINEHNKGTGMSKKSVKRAMKELVERKFIWRRKVNYWLYEFGPVMKSWVDKIEKKEMVKNTNDVDKSSNQMDKSSNQMDKSSNDLDKSGHNTIENNNRKEIEKKIEKIFSFFQKRIYRKARLSEEGRKKIEERLAEFDIEDLASAIRRFSQTSWWMVNHASKGPVWFFKDEDQIATFMGLKRDMSESEAVGYNEPEED